jgi:hypothetical protein
MADLNAKSETTQMFEFVLSGSDDALEARVVRGNHKGMKGGAA